MSHSPSTTDIAFAPADPSRIASQPSAFATITASRGVRVREVTSRGGRSSFSGDTCGGSVLSVNSIAGKLTAPATRSPLLVSSRCHNATCTAQSCRSGSLNSCVPSSGSIIQTRSAESRAALSVASSLSTASFGRCSRSWDIKNSCAIASPASFKSQP